MNRYQVEERLKKEDGFDSNIFSIKMKRENYTEEQYQDLKETLVILEKLDVFPISVK